MQDFVWLLFNGGVNSRAAFSTNWQNLSASRKSLEQ